MVPPCFGFVESPVFRDLRSFVVFTLGARVNAPGALRGYSQHEVRRLTPFLDDVAVAAPEGRGVGAEGWQQIGIAAARQVPDGPDYLVVLA